MLPVAYETLIVEIEDHVGLVRLNRPEALNALNSRLLGELGAALAEMDASARVRAIVITGSDKAFAAGADIKEMAPKSFVDMFVEDMFAGPAEAIMRCRKPVDRRGRRLLPRRRLRAGDDVRLHHRRRYREVRPAGGQPRGDAGHRRHPAADPIRRQIQGDGDVPDRADDGRRGGRARPGWSAAWCRRAT